MNRRQKISAALLFMVFALSIYFEAAQQSPLSWFESYYKTDKIPYGGKISYDLMADWKGPDHFTEVNIPPFEWLDKYDFKGTYLFFNSAFSSDEAEISKLLKWVRKGNTLFISANYIPMPLQDSLGVKTKRSIEIQSLKKNVWLNLSNPGLKADLPYVFDREIEPLYFSEIDTLNTVVLGVMEMTSESEQSKINNPHINFISQDFGEGRIILHTFPLAFTNYFLLDPDNRAYTEALLSYIPKEDVLYYDNYIKSGKTYFSSPLYLFLGNPYLKSAYYTLLSIAILWVVFEGKRKQRSIPIINPLANQSLSFTRTIAGMYLKSGEHLDIAQLSIRLFLDYCRNEFRVDTQNIQPELIEKIAEKSGCPLEKTERLFKLVDNYKNRTALSAEELIILNRSIEEFKTYQNGARKPNRRSTRRI